MNIDAGLAWVRGFTNDPDFQSILIRDLGSGDHRNTTGRRAEGILLPSAEAQKPEHAVPADQWQHATGFEAFRDDGVIRHT